MVPGSIFPRGLLRNGYKLIADGSHYPQGLLSSLYQVKSQMPFDFTLVAHINERLCAEQHLKVLEKDDVVVYDRGYYSYLMLHRHFESKIHAVFRLQKSNSAAIDEFFFGPETDITISVVPSARTRQEILEEYPDLDIIPIQMRLIKYRIGDETTCLGTTLLDRARYTKQDFIDIYHSRWGVEELFKVCKRIFVIEDFHAQTERGVKQEIFAQFVLVTMNRIFTNQADIELNLSGTTANQIGGDSTSGAHSSNQSLSRLKTNFKNCIHVFTRSIEELLLLQTKMETVVARAFLFIVGRHQKNRPGRSYQRKSMRPVTKWRDRTKRKNSKKAQKPPNALKPEDAFAVS